MPLPWYLQLRTHYLALILHRLLSLIVPIWTKDEGYWWAVGAAVARGGHLYVAAADNKPPLFLYAYALAIRWCGDWAFPVLHALVIAGNLAIAWLLYRIAVRWWNEPTARYVSLFYVVLQIAFTAQEQLAANSENLMMPWLIVSLIFIARSTESKRVLPDGGPPWAPAASASTIASTQTAIARDADHGGGRWQDPSPHHRNASLFWPLFAGLTLGIATGLRHTAILVAPVYLIALYTSSPARWRSIGIFLFGLAIPFASLYWHFHRLGTLADAWFWNITLTQLYVEESLPWQQLLIDIGWKVPAIAICAWPIWLLAAEHLCSSICHNGWRRLGAPPSADGSEDGGTAVTGPVLEQYGSSQQWLLLGSTLAMATAVTIGFRFSHHYFIQLFPFLALLAGAAIFHRASTHRPLWPVSSRLALGWLALAVCLFTAEAWYWGYRSLTHTHPKRVESIGTALRQMAQPNEALFVWGYYPEIYFDSGLPNASRFVETHFLTGQIRDSKSEGLTAGHDRLWAWLWDDLARTPPVWVVDTTAIPVSGRLFHNMEQHPEFAAWVQDHYTIAATLPHNVVVWKKRL